MLLSSTVLVIPFDHDVGDRSQHSTAHQNGQLKVQIQMGRIEEGTSAGDGLEELEQREGGRTIVRIDGANQ